MSSDNSKKIITAKQCKAARAFLNWSQQELAENVRVVQKTITDFERNARVPQRRTAEDIKTILEKAGIEFINDDKGQGAKLLNKLDNNK